MNLQTGEQRDNEGLLDDFARGSGICPDLCELLDFSYRAIPAIGHLANNRGRRPRRDRLEDKYPDRRNVSVRRHHRQQSAEMYFHSERAIDRVRKLRGRQCGGLD
jgi:hypothetical protein